MDVHRDFCEVAIAEAGAVRSAGRIATRPASLELFAASLAVSDVVALEVTGNAESSSGSWCSPGSSVRGWSLRRR
jgi:hypothetical protein